MVQSFAMYRFKRLIPNAQIAQIQKISATFNCLSIGIDKEYIYSSCRTCDNKHNTFVHVEHNNNNRIRIDPVIMTIFIYIYYIFRLRQTKGQ